VAKTKKKSQLKSLLLHLLWALNQPRAPHLPLRPNLLPRSK
jgi:hypothetical protein